MTYTAGEFTGFVRTCVKEAWFSRPGDAKGDTSFLTKSYYQHTEQAFYLTTKQMIEALSNNTDIALLQAWHKTLVSAAYQLFDHWAENGDISQVNPRRIVAARKKLAGFAYSNKVIEPLHIPKKQKQTKPKKEVV
jgi:CRISPR system Cascade subunit CasA